MRTFKGFGAALQWALVVDGLKVKELELTTETVTPGSGSLGWDLDTTFFEAFDLTGSIAPHPGTNSTHLELGRLVDKYLTRAKALALQVRLSPRIFVQPQHR